MSATAAEDPNYFSDDQEKDDDFIFSARTQEIRLTGDDDDHLHIIKSTKTVVRPSSSSHRSTGSNRVKINTIVDYPWKSKYYFGHLVASTRNGEVVAYSLIASKPSTTGLVRVIKPKTNQRTLIKEYQGHIKDLAFAFTDDPILASVDEYGTVLVHSIVEDDRTQLTTKRLLLLNRGDVTPSEYHMLFWCPYIPDPAENTEDSDDASASFDQSFMLLAMTHDCEVEVVNVNVLAQKYGSNTINTKTLPVNYKMVIEQEKPITVATISPDGSAIATGGLGGEVKFFQVSSESEGTSPGCLHCWVPHEGQPVSSVFFLDNWKQPQTDLQFWKFALTGANYNQELKLWSCETWKCLQTISLESSEPDTTLFLRAEIDSSSQYLLLSDIYNKAIYVVQIYHNTSHTKASFCSIAEFSVAHSVLSLTIVDALKCLIKMTDEIEPFEKNGNDQNGNGEDDDESPDNIPVKGTLIKCFWICEKSLQGSRITYQPPLKSSTHSEDNFSLMSHESILYRDRLSDLSADIQDSNSNTSLLDKDIPVYGDPDLALPMELTSTSCLQGTSDNNFGQNDYVSPTKPKENKSILTPPIILARSPITPSDIDASSGSANKLSIFGGLEDGVPIEPPLAMSEPIPPSHRKSSQRSSASSPSQEVADILAPIKTEREPLDLESHISASKSQTNGIASTEAMSTPVKNPMASLEASLSQSQTDFHSWPQAPDLSRMPARVSLDKESAYALGKPTELVVEKTEDKEVKAAIISIQQALESLNRNMFSLKNSHNNHGSDIKFLQQTLCNIQIPQQFQNLSEKIDKVEDSLYTHVKSTVSEQAQLDNNKMDTLFAKKQALDRQYMQKQALDASQSASSAVVASLDKAVKAEMKNSVIPSVRGIVDSWKEQVQQDFVQRMSISETGLKESMKSLFKNKNFIDIVSQNVAACIQPQIQLACRDLFQQNLVPNIEKVCQGLFLQLSDSFKTGIKEYLKQSQGYVERSTQELRGGLDTKIESVIASQMETVISKLHAKIEESWTRASSSLLVDIKKMISDEVKQALKEHEVSMEAHFVDGATHQRIMTPVPHPIDPQLLKQQILSLLRTGQHNAAFQEALNSKEKSILIFVCENVNPDTVFTPNACLLKFNVLVAMTYQLASCISMNTELTLKYIQGVICQLQAHLQHPSEPVNQTYLKKAVSALIQSLTFFTQNNPSSSFNSHIQILIMAANSVLAACYSGPEKRA